MPSAPRWGSRPTATGRGSDRHGKSATAEQAVPPAAPRHPLSGGVQPRGGHSCDLRHLPAKAPAADAGRSGGHRQRPLPADRHRYAVGGGIFRLLHQLPGAGRRAGGLFPRSQRRAQGRRARYSQPDAPHGRHPDPDGVRHVRRRAVHVLRRPRGGRPEYAGIGLDLHSEGGPFRGGICPLLHPG